MSASTVNTRTGYSFTQIALHWVIAILLVVNTFVSGEGMGQAWRSFERSNDAAGLSGFVPQAHLWIGVAVLAFALYRLYLRRTRGVPEAPLEESAVLRLAAHGTHILLYTLMILIPATGLAVYYFGIGTGRRHSRVSAHPADRPCRAACRRRALSTLHPKIQRLDPDCQAGNLKPCFDSIPIPSAD